MDSATKNQTVATGVPPALPKSVWKRPVSSLLSPTLLRIVLGISVGMVILAIVLPLPIVDRAVLGIAWLGPILWIPRQLERIARRADEDRWARSRRYHRLRGVISIFIDEVKRLNWLSVDAKRGLREESKVDGEMDVIQDRLHYLIGEMREAAGVSDGDE